MFLLLRFPVKAFSFCRAATLKNETTQFLLFLGLFFKNSQVALRRSRNVESSEFLEPCSRRLWDLQKVGRVPWHCAGRLQKPPGIWICINVFVLWLVLWFLKWWKWQIWDAFLAPFPCTCVSGRGWLAQGRFCSCRLKTQGNEWKNSAQAPNCRQCIVIRKKQIKKHQNLCNQKKPVL